jgi:capsular exopolysaccharide synthesis family protein
MSNDNFDNIQVAEEESSINIRDFLQDCLVHWKWFAASVVILLCLAYAYLLTASPVYTRTASILVKEDDSHSSISSQLSNLSDLSVYSAGADVSNEVYAIQSPSTILEVVRRLKLDMSYTTRQKLKTVALYGNNLPITATIINCPDNDACSFVLYPDYAGRTVTLEKFAYKQDKFDDVVKGALGDTLTTPIGKVVVTPTDFYNTEATKKFDKINVAHSGTQASIETYQSKLKAEIADKHSAIINITCTDVNTQRAEDVLTTLISAYNEDWVRDKNQVAIATSQFINERLNVIEQELGNVDSDISSYKSEHLIPDVAEVSRMYLEQGQKANDQVLDLNNQLYMARYIRNFLADSRNNGQLLPANAGIANTNIEQQISEYNTRMLERNSLVANSSANNPLVVDRDNALNATRQAIIHSIDNEINALNTQIRTFRGSEAQSRNQIASNPNQAKYLLSVERQQKVKEALYLFLLQKREENELTQAFTAYNTRIITPPMGSLTPISPRKSLTMLVALVVGLLIPGVVLFLQASFDNKIRNRNDITPINAPFIGELPMAGNVEKKGLLASIRAMLGFKPKAGAVKDLHLVVREGSRNVINEAYRVVRSNLEFIIGKRGERKVIMFTSLIPGSGKTFISANLAASFAVNKKRVCAIDLDLRKATLSGYIGTPRVGITNYLNGEVADWKQIIRKVGGVDNYDMIPVGTIPPNPSELLYSDHLQELINKLRQEYDFVFIDCPPTEIVADTTIITPMADVTVFVVRSGLLERRYVANIKQFYEDKKFNNMVMLLNGVPSHTSGYGYGYGYDKSDE